MIDKRKKAMDETIAKYVEERDAKRRKAEPPRVAEVAEQCNAEGRVAGHHEWLEFRPSAALVGSCTANPEDGAEFGHGQSDVPAF